MATDPSEALRRVRRSIVRAKKLASDQWDKASARRFQRSPAGRARTAHGNGDSVFQLRERVTDKDHGAVLSSIEAEGWVLSDTQHVQEVSSRTDPDGGSRSETDTYAVYLFRRRE